VEKRSAAGLMFNAFYTWSKTLNESEADGSASGGDILQPASRKGPLDYRLSGIVSSAS